MIVNDVDCDEKKILRESDVSGESRWDWARQRPHNSQLSQEFQDGESPESSWMMKFFCPLQSWGPREKLRGLLLGLWSSRYVRSGFVTRLRGGGRGWWRERTPGLIRQHFPRSRYLAMRDQQRSWWAVWLITPPPLELTLTTSSVRQPSTTRRAVGRECSTPGSTARRWLSSSNISVFSVWGEGQDCVLIYFSLIFSYVI